MMFLRRSMRQPKMLTECEASQQQRCNERQYGRERISIANFRNLGIIEI